MRTLILGLMLVLLLVPSQADNSTILTYPDGTRQTYQNANQGLEDFLIFLEGSQDGRIVLRFKGKDMVAVKQGEQVDFTFNGQTDRTTGKQIAVMFREARQKHNPVVQCQSNLKALGAANAKYRATNGHYPMSLGELVPQYLPKIPACPSTGEDTYSRSFEVAGNPDQFTLACTGNHTQSGLPRGYPMFTSGQGLIER